jgi:hypothetical protein
VVVGVSECVCVCVCVCVCEDLREVEGGEEKGEGGGRERFKDIIHISRSQIISI